MVDSINYFITLYPEIPIYILLKKRPSFDRRTEITGGNIIIKDFPGPSAIAGSFFFVAWVWIQILKHNPLAIFTSLSPFAIPVLLARKVFFWRKNVILVNEGHYTSTHIHTMTFPLIQYWGVRILYPTANRICVPTRAIRDNLKDYFRVPPHVIQVVPNWSRYAKTKHINTVRTVDLIYIGRIERTKRVLEMLVIIKSLIHDYNIKIRCELIGDGSEVGACKRYITYHRLIKNVHILPPTLKVNKHLAGAKVLIFNTEERTEGFPVAILDAMSLGTIVISRFFEGINDVITSNKNGFIVYTDREMYECIFFVLSHYNSLGKVRKAAKEYVKEHNSTDNISEYIKILYGPDRR